MLQYKVLVISYFTYCKQFHLSMDIIKGLKLEHIQRGL